MDNTNPTGTPQGATSPLPPETPPTHESGVNPDPKTQVKNWVGQFEAWLDLYMIKKAPFQIPMGGKEFLATIAPYLVILGAVLFLLSLPALLGLGALGNMMGDYAGYGWSFSTWMTVVTSVVAIVLELYALSGLFKRTRRSWRLVYYATLVSFAGSVLSFNLIGAVIGGVISWYLLFQVKELYKN